LRLEGGPDATETVKSTCCTTLFTVIFTEDLHSISVLAHVQVAASGQGVAAVDPAAARKAEEEAEERRLAEIRSHGTMVTPQTFAEWKQRFEAEMAPQRGSLHGDRAANLHFQVETCWQGILQCCHTV
jgi:hypothetical protein